MMSDGQASALPILTPSAVLSQGNAMFSSLNVLRKQEGSFQTLHPRPGLSSHPDGSSLPSTFNHLSKPPPQHSSPDCYRGSLFSPPHSLQTCDSYRTLLTTSAHDSWTKVACTYTWSKVTALCNCGAYLLRMHSVCFWCLYICLREGTVLFTLIFFFNAQPTNMLWQISA